MNSELLGATVGRYRILSVIGRGGMASVYKAVDTGTGRLVALKVFAVNRGGPSEFESAFHREAVASARLHHPNILAVHDVGVLEGCPYVVTEYIDGKSLAQILTERASLEVDYAVTVVSQVGSALAFAHRQGLIHRDVKPQNILISTDGRVVLCDFGLSMQPGEGTISRTGIVVGTPTYMAPEQAMGLPLDPRTDVFSLGVVLYQALTGQRPFTGGVGSDSVADILKRVVESDPQPVRTFNVAIPVALEQVVRRALEKEPSRRYQTAANFVTALKSVALDQTTVPPTSSWSHLDDFAMAMPPGRAEVAAPRARGRAEVAASTAKPARSKRLLVLAATVLILIGSWWARRVFPGLPIAITVLPFLVALVVVLALRMRDRQPQPDGPTNRDPIAISAHDVSNVPALTTIGNSTRRTSLSTRRTSVSASSSESVRDDSADATAAVPKYGGAPRETLLPTLRDPMAGAWLLVLDGPRRGRQFRLGRSFMIGRARDNDLVLPDSRISRRHVKIVPHEDTFRLLDSHSGAGTVVNGLRVQEHDLRDRDEIIVGETRLLFINVAEESLPVLESRRRLRDFASIWDELTRAAHDPH